MKKIGVNNQKGITLIALVITIILLLILAGASINMITGEDGILKNAVRSKEDYENARMEELISLAYAEYKIESEKSFSDILNNSITGFESLDEKEEYYIIKVNGIGYRLDKEGNIENGLDSANGESKLQMINNKQSNVYDFKIYGNTIQDGTPAPDTPIEIKSVGDKTANLFNINGKIIHSYATDLTINGNTVTATATSPLNFTNSKILLDDIKAGTTVILSAEISASSTNQAKVLLAYFDTSTQVSTEIEELDNTGSIEITMPEKTSDSQVLCMILYGNANGTGGVGYYSTYKNIQLEIGTAPTEYESYGYRIPVKVNDVTTNIYLDEPLRKIGDYTDYIDLKNQKVVRNVKETIFTGTENWVTTAIAGQVNTTRYTVVPLDLNLEIGSININSFNTHFNVIKFEIDDIGFLGTYDNKNYSIKSTILDDVGAFKTWIKEQYNNGTPIKVNYVLESPTEETIEIPNIEFNEGTNIVEVNTQMVPSKAEITYYNK